MVEITVKAADSASAMEEIEKRLGADAMIVSTNRVDGQIEIVATNDDPSKYQKPPEPLVPVSYTHLTLPTMMSV